MLRVTLLILFGDLSFKLEILKLGDERIKTVWFKKHKSTWAVQRYLVLATREAGKGEFGELGSP